MIIEKRDFKTTIFNTTDFRIVIVVIKHINTKLILVDPLIKDMQPHKLKDNVVTMGHFPTS